MRRAGVVALALAGVTAGCGSSSHRVGAAPPPTTTTAAPASAAPAPTSGPAGGTTDRDQTFMYHRDLGHDGYDPLTPPFTAWHPAWSAGLDGQVYGQPLVVGDHVIATTQSGTVYALALATGQVVWHTHVIDPASHNALPCGDVEPTVGITSTPAYDPASNRIYTVALTPTQSSVKHVLFALDATTGQVVLQRDVDVQADGIDPAAMNQRAALTITGGRVYVPYGGNYGDCGSYRGALVSSRLDGTGPLGQLVVPTTREGGIWAPGGAAVDAAGDLYVAVGNGAVGQGDSAGYDSSDSVIKLSPDLRQLSIFSRAQWRQDNDTDADLGSAAPLLVGAYVWAEGKFPTGYLLRQSDLGGVGHPFRTVDGACDRQFGGPAAHGLTIYASCTDGIRQITVGPDGSAHLGWKADVYGSPVVGGGVVVAVEPSSGTLYAFDERTGAVRGRVGVGDVSHFATPALHDDLVLVPTLAGITAVRGA